MILEKNKLKSNNLVLRIISALVALIIVCAALHLYGIDGAFFMIIIVSVFVSIEFTNLFFDQDKFFKYFIPILTSVSLVCSIKMPAEPLSILPLYIGLIALPWAYRNSTIQVSFDKLTVYLLIALYCYILPLQIFKIFSLDPDFYYFYFFGLLVFGVDTLAYFFGKLFGHKFFKSAFQPNISSSKTIEGFIGSLLWPGTLMIAASSLGLFQFSALSIILIYLTALTAISGDLIASLIKRKSQKKDSGQIFVGHGGFLDRFDSLLLSAPIFLLASSSF